jgi:hypothetical protein
MSTINTLVLVEGERICLRNPPLGETEGFASVINTSGSEEATASFRSVVHAETPQTSMHALPLLRSKRAMDSRNTRLSRARKIFALTEKLLNEVRW